MWLEMSEESPAVVVLSLHEGRCPCAADGTWKALPCVPCVTWQDY
jgi:hypothetical protein